MRDMKIIFFFMLVLVACLPQMEKRLDEMPLPEPTAIPKPIETPKPIPTPDMTACEIEVGQLREENAELRAQQYAYSCSCWDEE
jgi:hypothetical protein